MEFSTNSMSDNSFDKDNPLKQVLQLCSTLAGKGCEFSISVRIKDSFSFSLKSGKPQDKKGKKRSPSFYRRQERRKLLKKKNKDCSLEQPLETPESKQKDTCSLDLNPHPDSGLFGLRENSEEESDEESDSGSETSRNASRGDQEAVSENQEDMDADGHWKVVSRGRRRSDRSLSPVLMKKHKFVVKLEEPGWPSDTKEVFVNAPSDVAKADVANAVHQCNPREFFPQDGLPPLTYPGFWNPATREPEGKLKYIKELQEYEFSSTNIFKH